MRSAKFSLGQTVATPGALKALENAGQEPAYFLARHAACDWGEVPDEDKQSNGEALAIGARLLSAYTLASGIRIWVITEAADDDGQREATTILLPDEY
ncbi:hypothetical protein [Bremerella alba]|uniref:Plasmid related protein n=1 Tax=Bremerella alba TaxID=980252 RepID=A0A7V9A8Q7_9BACT|nr:hypothetical protein [Bremerella alba]MBA2116677.1 hypothetical protein [Bremerella alba]